MSNNATWEARRMQIGIRVRINDNATIDVVIINGEILSSPYRDGNGMNEIVNGPEAQKYVSFDSFSRRNGL